MSDLIDLVTAIRTVRATYEVDPRRRIDVTILDKAASGFVDQQAALIKALARIERLEIAAQADRGARTIVQASGTFEIHIPMAGLFDIAAERARLAKERGKIDAEVEGLRRKLGNPQFVERAKAQVVAQSRERVSELEARRVKVEETLRELEG